MLCLDGGFPAAFMENRLARRRGGAENTSLMRKNDIGIKVLEAGESLNGM
jgi:hypothetical protein